MEPFTRMDTQSSVLLRREAAGVLTTGLIPPQASALQRFHLAHSVRAEQAPAAERCSGRGPGGLRKQLFAGEKAEVRGRDTERLHAEGDVALSHPHSGCW